MLEVTVEDYLVGALVGYGRCEKVVDQSRRGHPDREVQWLRDPHGRRRGGLDKVELKRPKGKAEKHQIRYHEYLATCGVPVYLLDTKDKIDAYMMARIYGAHVPELFSVPCNV